VVRRTARLDDVTLDDDDLMTGAGESERRREPRDAAAGDDEFHGQT
jgi:hypothetical protein